MNTPSMDVKLDFSDVLILPQVPTRPLTSRAAIDLSICFKSYSGLPLMVANMPSIGTYKIANLLSAEKIVTFIYKNTPKEDHLIELRKMETTKYVGITTGVHEEEIQRVLDITDQVNVGFIALDTANIYGNFETILKKTELIKKKRPQTLLVVGNVCTPEIVAPLANSGADLIKVGVGSGSACLTRSEVGVGVPQLAAVLETVLAAKEHPIGIISDGGCVNSGDICKALAAGSHFVMLGGMLAGSIECDNIVYKDGKPYVHFWGLGSKKQFEDHNTSEKQYRPNEGRNLLVPCSGSIFDTLSQIQGALRSACTYVGCEKIADLSRKAKFIRVTTQLNSSLAQFEIK